MTITNSGDAKNGEHHLPLHGFGDHEKHPSMAHNLIITITLITDHHPYLTGTRQDQFYLTNKHQPLSQHHIALADQYQAVLGLPVG